MCKCRWSNYSSYLGTCVSGQGGAQCDHHLEANPGGEYKVVPDDVGSVSCAARLAGGGGGGGQDQPSGCSGGLPLSVH